MAASLENVKLLSKHLHTHIKKLGYKNGDRVRLRAFPPESKYGINADFVYPSVPLSLLDEWQSKQCGVYVIVNPGGHKDQDIEHCVACFYEHDDLSKELSLDLWRSLGLPEPTLQIDTGGKSIHSYWVFEHPVAVEDWRSLQTDLLEYSDGDRSLKNPSRVMRLAGCRHARTGEFSRIVGGNGELVPFDTLRGIIPRVQSELPLSVHEGQVQRQGWTEFDKSFQLPHSEQLPLEVCLSRESRELIASGATSDRNTTGAKLARDIVGTAAYLQGLGQSFSGNPRSLFDSYCCRCSSGGGWGEREWNSIWKSAEGDRPGPSLSPEKIEACAKSWIWKNCIANEPVSSNSETASEVAEVEDIQSKASKLEGLIVNAISAENPYTQALLEADILSEFKGVTHSTLRLLKNLATAEPPKQFQGLADVGQAVFADMEARSISQALVGTAYGFEQLDRMTQGAQQGEVTVIAGRPAMGKTAFCLALSKNIALKTQKPVLYISLEMVNKLLYYRLLSSECGIESMRLMSGLLSETEWAIAADAMHHLGKMLLMLNDSPGFTVEQICKQVLDLAEHHGDLGAVFIDHIGLIEPAQGRTRSEELGVISRSLKRLAMTLSDLGLKTPIFPLSQLSRGVEGRTDKRPYMHDLRESGSLEQDAGTVLMLYRAEYYDSNTPDHGVAEVLIRKQRMGPTGTVKLLFEPEFSRFRDLPEVA